MNAAHMRRFLLLPGLLFAALGSWGLVLLGLPVRVPTWDVLLWSSVFAFATLMLSTRILERTPSFMDASAIMESAVRQLQLTPTWAWGLSFSSGVGEELLFRGLLLFGLSHVWPVWAALLLQAVLFAALHPAPRRAWAYTLWTLLAAVFLGVVALATNSVLPGIVAHVAFNAHHFDGVVRRDEKTNGDGFPW